MPSNPSCLGFERLGSDSCGCLSKMSRSQVCACLEFHNYFCNFNMCQASLGLEREREREHRILKKENPEENSL